MLAIRILGSMGFDELLVGNAETNLAELANIQKSIHSTTKKDSFEDCQMGISLVAQKMKIFSNSLCA